MRRVSLHEVYDLLYFFLVSKSVIPLPPTLHVPTPTCRVSMHRSSCMSSNIALSPSLPCQLVNLEQQIYFSFAYCSEALFVLKTAIIRHAQCVYTMDSIVHTTFWVKDIHLSFSLSLSSSTSCTQLTSSHHWLDGTHQIPAVSVASSVSSSSCALSTVPYVAYTTKPELLPLASIMYTII